MDDSFEGALCTRLLFSVGHALSDECGPIVQVLDNPRELDATGAPTPFSQQVSQGEPWPDVEPRQGRESQLSLESTQGVDIPVQ